MDMMFDVLLGESTDDIVGRFAIGSAIAGFLIHILVWLLHTSGSITVTGDSVELVKSPLSTLYTPFSILLTYEVYQLIRAIPESFSAAVGKQFEIATLLVVRDILKRLANIDFTDEWVIDDDLLLLLVECAAFLALFYTSLSYHKFSNRSSSDDEISDELSKFIEYKKGIATLMMPVFLFIAGVSLLTWISSIQDGTGGVSRAIFFLDFFTFLILADILILLISYRFYTDFSNLARNTGFVLSTVIIRVAISSVGVSSMILFTLSGVVGIAVLRISSSIRTEGKPIPH